MKLIPLLILFASYSAVAQCDYTIRASPSRNLSPSDVKIAKQILSEKGYNYVYSDADYIVTVNNIFYPFMFSRLTLTASVLVTDMASKIVFETEKSQLTTYRGNRYVLKGKSKSRELLKSVLKKLPDCSEAE